MARRRRDAVFGSLGDQPPLEMRDGAEQLSALDQIFAADAPDGATRLTWLKTIPVAVKADHIQQIFELLKLVRQIGIPAEAASAVHPDRYR